MLLLPPPAPCRVPAAGLALFSGTHAIASLMACLYFARKPCFYAAHRELIVTLFQMHHTYIICNQGEPGAQLAGAACWPSGRTAAARPAPSAALRARLVSLGRPRARMLPSLRRLHPHTLSPPPTLLQWRSAARPCIGCTAAGLSGCCSRRWQVGGGRAARARAAAAAAQGSGPFCW